MTTLVTGGAGFIGSHCVQALLAKGERVVVVDDFDDYYDPAIKRANLAPFKDDPAVRVVEADIRDADAMTALFAEEKPDALLHLAARAGVRPSLADPALYEDVNVRGTEVVLAAAEAAGVARYVLASSSSVYGERMADRPFSESDPLPEPASPYAKTKQEMEEVARAFQARTGKPVTCLRFFTVYGPGQRPDMAIHKFVAAVERGEPITAYGDGTTLRDYTYIDDIVDGILASFARAAGYRVYNLGSGRTVTLKELIADIEAAVGKEAKVTWLPMQEGDVTATFADIGLAHRELGYAPRHADCRDGIAKFVRWYRGLE